MAKKFRKKPVVIEAIQFDASSKNLVELSEFVGQPDLHYDPDKEQIKIEAPEGNQIASKGDWIIKGVQGECYPCKPNIFDQTYEPV